MNLSQQIGQNIKQARLKQKLSQQALADRASISVSHLRIVEQGGNFSVEVLERITHSLGLEAVDLVRKQCVQNEEVAG